MSNKPDAPPTKRPPTKPRPPAKWHPTRPTRAQVKRARDFLAPALLAFVVVLGTAAADSGDGDWELLIPGEPPICAKSSDACNEARDALAEGRWLPVGADPQHAPFRYIICKPHPGCFPAASLTIPGYNDK